MRKLYNEFFYIPKHGKVREKVMLAHIAMTVTIVIMCLAAMSITAYAYFSYNITSGSNVIKSANFKLQVQITDANGEAIDKASTITSNYQLYKIADLKVGEWYTVTIKQEQTENSAKTGFVIVTATGCTDSYHTQQLGVDESVTGGKTTEIKFQIMITKSTDVVFEAHWGTSSNYSKFKDTDDEHYIIYKDGEMEKITITVAGVKEPPTKSNKEDKVTPPGSTITSTAEESSSMEESSVPSTNLDGSDISTQPSEEESSTEYSSAEATSPTEPSLTANSPN